MLSFPRTFARDIRPWNRLFEEIEAAAAPHHSLFKSQNLNFNSFTPSFDVKENKDSYVLDGELPGVSDKSALDLSFVDDNTLVIKGRIERNSETGNPAPEKNQEATEDKANYQAPIVEEEGSSSTEQTVTKTSFSTEVEKQQPQETEKYWVRERYVGEFQRAFSFPQKVNHEAVKASLKDGILSVVIPKKKGPDGVRKITIE